MAGILGIIPTSLSAPSCSADQFQKMMSGLMYQDTQPTAKIEIDNVWLGVAGRVNTKKVEIYKADKIFCVCEGDIQILPDVKDEINKLYPDLSNKNVASLIPFLFEKYGLALPKKLSGNYNICCFNSESRKALLFNGRFGMLPLFYYINNGYLIFSSKLNPIIKSGMVNVDWDHLTQLEQIIFNYPVSDHSLIVDVKTLRAGSMIKVNKDKLDVQEYWSVSELFARTPLARKESFEAVYNGFENAIIRGINLFEEESRKKALSLTGGWDGRLGLSYLLKNGLSEKLIMYSFGAKESPDVQIPDSISKQLGIPYYQILLNNFYVENEFLTNAYDTIMLSNGHRPFVRTHYLFTMKKMAENVDVIISGNCGSNILKFGLIKPGTVFSHNLFSLIISGEMKKWVETIDVKYSQIVPGIDKLMLNELAERVRPLFNKFKNAETQMQGYYSILLSIVERKFFGAEQNGYNDFVYNYSPFIDYQFIDTLSRTLYWGPNYPFNSNSLKLRKLSTDLYSQIVKRNSAVLWNAKTDRDVSFKELTTLMGKIKIIKRKLLSKGSGNDNFHTHSLSDIFTNHFKLEADKLLNREETANFLSTELFRKKITV